MRGEGFTGKVVRFIGKVGNEFHEGDIAICLSGVCKLFLGLSGDKFGRVWYESNKFEVIPTNKKDIEDILRESRIIYFEGKGE